MFVWLVRAVGLQHRIYAGQIIQAKIHTRVAKLSEDAAVK